MAANQLQIPTARLGWLSGPSPNASSLALSGALSGSYSQTWLALAFVLDTAKTLSAFRMYLKTLTGAAGSNCVVDFFSDNGSGAPNASIAGPFTSSGFTAGAWNSWTGLSVALSASTQYWAVLRNSNGTPTSNYPTWNYMTGLNAGLYNTGASWGWLQTSSTNSGSTWASTQIGAGGFRLDFSDSTYAGIPISGTINGAAGNRSYASNEQGASFNVPANMNINLRQALVYVSKTGTPNAASTMAVKIYSGSLSLLATSSAVPVGNVNTGSNGYLVSFASDVQLSSANNPYYLTVQDTYASETSANGYNPVLLTWDGDANSLTLKPMNGSMRGVYTTNAGTSFTPTDTTVMPFVLYGDTAGEFSSTGGGSSGMTCDVGWTGGFSG